MSCFPGINSETHYVSQHGKSSTHNKAEAFLQVNIPDASVSFEEPLDIFLPGGGAQAADEDATPAHVNDVSCGRGSIPFEFADSRVRGTQLMDT